MPHSTIPTTTQAQLRDAFGVNTHWPYGDPTIYGGKTRTLPNSALLDALIQLGVGCFRERYFPHSARQQTAHAVLLNAGLKLYATIGDNTYQPEQIIAEVDALADLATAFPGGVLTVCGPNEANANGGDTWAPRLIERQRTLYEAVRSKPSLDSALVVAPALKHNGVKDYDADLRAIAPLAQWCDAGDFHFYGDAVTMLAERERVRQAFGDKAVCHSEFGCTGESVDELTAAEITYASFVRAYLAGFLHTLVYELADERPTDPQKSRHEGLFGLHTGTRQKAAYVAVQSFIGAASAAEPFPGWIGKEYGLGDAQALVTSQGDSCWQVHVATNVDDTPRLWLPVGLTVDGYEGHEGLHGDSIAFDLPLGASTVACVAVHPAV